jgi:hypothetical protein
VSAAKPLPAVAARALATGQGALEAISAQLQEAARAYIPLSHLLWGLWGLIQVPCRPLLMLAFMSDHNQVQ